MAKKKVTKKKTAKKKTAKKKTTVKKTTPRKASPETKPQQEVDIEKAPLEQLVPMYQEQKALIELEQAKLNTMLTAIVSMSETKDEGSKTTEVGQVKMTGTTKMNRTIDTAMLEECLEKDWITPEQCRKFINYKPSLNTTAYRDADLQGEDIWLTSVVKTTPGKPSLSFKPIKE